MTSGHRWRALAVVGISHLERVVGTAFRPRIDRRRVPEVSITVSMLNRKLGRLEYVRVALRENDGEPSRQHHVTHATKPRCA